MSLPALEATLWWGTYGTSCCVVAAVTADDARVLLRERFRDAGMGHYTGKPKPCTPEQYRRYEGAMAQTVKWATL